MRKVVIAVLATLCVGGAGAAAKWGPTWSEVTGERYSKATMHAASAIIKSVDGRHYTTRVVKLEPGERLLVVQSPDRKGFRGSDRELKLMIEPCIRYYINAQFKSSVGTEWEPTVAKKEPIAGCKRPAAA